MRQLDGLRAVAVAAVTWFHWSPVGTHLWGTSLGEMGVQLFFVLSGFLITGILLDARARNPSTPGRVFAIRQFYIRRALRLFPLLYLVVLLAVVLEIPPFPESWPWHVLYMSNIYQFIFGWQGYGSNLWTLGIEEQFYLCWPLFVLFVPPRVTVRMLVCMVILAPLTRWVLWNFGEQGVNGAGDPNRLPIAALDCLGVGAALAFADRRIFNLSAAQFAKLGLSAGLAGYCVIHLTNGAMALEQTCLAMIFVWVVWKGSVGFGGWTGRFLESTPTRFIGQISYGIYVFQGFSLAYWHWWVYSAPMPGYRLFTRLGLSEEQYSNAAFVAAGQAFVNIGVALISWRLLELPVNNLRRYFPYTRTLHQSSLP
jgi:peptidoglycan/LPS O-acetylase OafA/YrhL